MPEKETIGYIGLGNMGMPMARNLVRVGYPVVVHDIDPARVRTLVGEGAAAAESPAEMASRASVIFSSLPTGESVEDVATGPGGILEGGRAVQVYIDMSTIPPPVCERVGARLGDRGIDMLDAPVTGGKAGAAAGTLGIMVGGRARAFERCRPLLEVLGGVVQHFGEAVGSGMHAKLANQIMVGAHLAAFAEALAYGKRAGLDLHALVDILKSGRAGSEILNVNSPGILDGNLEELGAMGPMTLLRKDLDCVVESMAAMGVEESLSHDVRGMYDRLIDEDDGKREVARDCMGLIYLYQDRFGVEVIADAT
jgi:2-hydroxy-3-oxopropionate reductase